MLFVLDSLVAGGAERSTVALLPSLIERGIEPEVAILHDRPGLHDEVRSMGVPIHDVSGRGGRIGWIHRLRSLVATIEPDLVHTSLYEADVCGRIAARLGGVPVVSTLATVRYGADHFDVPGVSRPKLRLAQVTDAATARLTVRLHAVSDHVADHMAINLRHPRDRIVRIHRGRPLPPSASRNEIDALRLALDVGERPLVLAVARHEWVKGVDRLVDAVPTLLADHPDAVVFVAGRDGAQSDELRAAMRDRAVEESVRLLGHRDDVALLLAAADVFVLPSRREGLPGVVLEAMAIGCPVVASDIPQVREVVGDDHASLVDAGNPVALAQALSEVITDPREAAERAGRAEARFRETFTLDRIADAMTAFYRDVLTE